tara:strand:+ start:45 stop:1646 length:1602 start_codon:yes stop_codon:yes gene_type:complete
MLNNLKSYIYIIRYFFFNKNLFKKKKSKNIILLEANELYPSHVAYSYFANILADLHQAKIVSYYPIFKNLLQKFMNFKIYIIYKSFGVSKFLFYKKKNIKTKFNFKNRKEIIKFKINEIIIGDLIYDSYLREKNKPTINLDDHEFTSYFNECLQIFYFWEEYFKKNCVKAIILSHTTYKLAIPLRIASANGIPGYSVGINSAYYIDNLRYTETNSKAYSEFFDKLSDEDKKKAIEKSKIYLDAKFDNNSGYEKSAEIFQAKTPYVLENDKYKTFGKSKNINILNKNGNLNILITAHCFYDSPHAVSGLLFDDFFHWIDHLGQLSEKTNYNWYLKKHPHSGNKKLNNVILNNFTKKYPKLKILGEDINNSELLSEKIDLVLTVYGSVGYEFPYLGIPVLLGATGTSYENYTFCVQPKTIAEYDNFIISLKNSKNSLISKEEVCSYFFSKYLCNWDLLDNFVENKIKYKTDFFSPIIFKIWMDQRPEKKTEKIYKEIEKFILNKTYNLVTNNIINFDRIHSTPQNQKIFGIGKGI